MTININDYMHNPQFCAELLAKVTNDELTKLEEAQLYTDVCNAMRENRTAPNELTDIRYALAEKRVHSQNAIQQAEAAAEMQDEADALTPEFVELTLEEIREKQQNFLNGHGEWTQQDFEQSRLAMRAKIRAQRTLDQAAAEEAAIEQAAQARTTLEADKRFAAERLARHSEGFGSSYAAKMAQAQQSHIDETINKK